MGAHSGTSSEDLYFILGIDKPMSSSFVSYNIEKHGLKNMLFPELKSELVVSFNRKISNNFTLNTLFEYEIINNFDFIEKNKSISRPIWIGFIYHFN